MLVTFHFAVCFLLEIATPPWQRAVRDISRAVVDALEEAEFPGVFDDQCE